MAPQGDPRKETPIDMCKVSCCPNLSIKSFTAIITIIEIIIYIVTLILTFVNGHLRKESLDFLPPGNQELDDFGSRLPYNIVCNYQVWRFVTPIFLHAHFLHIFFNMTSQMILGSQIEVLLGTVKMIIIYFLCGIGGNLFGGYVNSAPAVGASTSIVGLLGVLIAFVVVNWKRLDPQLQCFLSCMIAFVVLFNVVFVLQGSANGQSQSLVDNYGHLGGLITGAFAGMIMVTPMGGPAGPYEKKVKVAGIVLTSIFFATFFALFFTKYKC